MSMHSGEFRGLSRSGFHRVAYVAWGRPGSLPPVICVHGLTRNGRDFDRLAWALAAGRSVICPDVVGRGRSGWLKDASNYALPQYCNDMTALIAHLGADQVDWVGTSMGGLIGMTLAAQADTPIRRLVLNDIGPFIPSQALQRLAGYVGKDPVFRDLGGAETYLRETFAGFGTLDDAAWQQMALHGVRRRADGQYGLAYDPAIGRNFNASLSEDVDLSRVWGAVRCPVLVLRGANSDLLLPETARAMSAKAEVIEIPGVGHAPSLMVAAQIEAVRAWLERS